MKTYVPMKYYDITYISFLGDTESVKIRAKSETEAKEKIQGVSLRIISCEENKY